MIKFLKKYWERIFLVIFIVIASILRFYHITRLEFFTYDQARDALFVKRMIIDHEFRLLGTQTSLPGMYLPPFYYYTIVPILWIFRLNPVGIDIYSALIGVLSVPLVFLVANKIFGKPAGLFSAGLFAASPLVVELTRRAWNPNTLPFFILITFYFIYLYFKEGRTRDFLLTFGFYGYCLSLHFGAWTLLPLFMFTWGYAAKKRRFGRWVLLGGLGLVAFFVCPLLFFEFRHNFFLVSQAKIFFFDGGHIGPKDFNIIEQSLSSLVALFTILISGKILVGYGAPLEFAGKIKDLFLLSQPISVVAQKPFSISFQWWGLVIFLFIVVGSILFFKKNRLALSLIWIWVLWGVLVSRLYSGKFFFFYYLFLFPAPVLLFGFLFQKIWQNTWLRPVTLLFFILIIIFHLKFTTVFAPGWRDINDLKKVAEVIANDVFISRTASFNIATIQKEADRWDHNAIDYRYFVETFSHQRAKDWYPQDYQKVATLYVVDETGVTNPLKSNIMEIKEFGASVAPQKWVLDKGIVVYKLYQGE